MRGIIKLVTAVANGDLSQKFTMDAQGEIAALADTLNTMTDTLRAFAERGHARRVARSVPKASSVARRRCPAPPARGATSPTTSTSSPTTSPNQIRAMAEVATAVTEGDLTRQHHRRGAGRGRSQLKERVNQMIANLRETTQKNREQDWLKTNLAKFSRHDAGAEEPRERRRASS